MVAWNSILTKSYWILAGLGGIWATFMICLINPWFQRHALYLHKLHTGFWHDVSNPESFGFAKGQVQPFWLDTSDGEQLFCWHVLPLDVYLDNENEIVTKYTGGIVDGLEGTVGGKLLKKDLKSRVVVNFHGNAGHIAQGYRPSTYRSMSGIPHTHVLTCDYRGFGLSTLKNAPHAPTETGIITDGISLVSYIINTLNQPSSRIVLLGQSLGTGVASASALYFTDPESEQLPKDLTPPKPEVPPQSFAGIVLVAGFTDLPQLLKSYSMGGIIPIFSPMRPYPRIENFLVRRIRDLWPTQERLKALLSASGSPKTKTSVHLTLLHARNDQEITFRESDQLYSGLEATLLAEEGSTSTEERRSIHGGERVKRGAFAYRKVEDGSGTGERTVELEIVRYGGHNQVVGFSQVALAVRRAWKVKTFKPGFDVE